MKPLINHIIFFLTLLSSVSLQAQFGNEWIEYNLTYYKFKVTSDGLYRIPYSTLNTLPNSNINNVLGVNFNLYHMGQPVPIYVSTTGNFGSNDFIEFYGKRNDGTLDTRLFSNPSHQVNKYHSLFNDSSTYYLTWNGSNPNILINNIPNDLTNLPPIEQYFMHTVRTSITSNYQLGKPTWIGPPPPFSGGQPVYESIFDEGEGFTGIPFNQTTSNNTVVVPNIYSNAPVNPTINISLLSISTLEHKLRFRFNTYTIADTTFRGFRMSHFSYNFPLNQLNNYNNLGITAMGTEGIDRNAVAVIECIYPHEFLRSDAKFYFKLNPGSAARYFEMLLFNDKNTAPILYDLTNHLRIVGTQSSGKFKLPAQSQNIARELFLTSQNSSDILTITSMERVNFVNYFNQAFQGDYVIISHQKLRDDGNGVDNVSAYAKYRNSIQGGNHQVAVLMIDQLYDQFCYGVRKHPLAIRNFVDFAMANWVNKPEHIFLIGKAREYNAMRTTSSAYQQCLVPTFGNPGSDILLAATNTSIAPRVAVGRLSAENGAAIGKYLEKVMAYERVQAERGDPHQKIDEKIWMKRVLHMGGGEGIGQQTQFKGFLQSYESIIKDTLYGADVTSFYKTSTAPIQVVQSDYMRDLINTGVSLITFFGHSSPNSFDIAIDDPEQYNNFERYHLILSNGCFTGNIYNPSPGISERFVLADSRAAIGFISTISLSSSGGLHTYSSNFYNNLSRKHYGKSIGTIMRMTAADVESCCNAVINRGIVEEMTLHGDPGLKLNIHPKPDYSLEPQMVSFLPSTVTVEQESFDVKVIVTNLGMALADSINLVVTRFFPDAAAGSIPYVKRMRGTMFSDTVIFTIPTGGASAFGLNTFHIKIDFNDEVDELSETNNELGGIILNITSDDLIPIHPYEFAIVPNQPVTLKASTASPFAPIRTYRLEIDTTELFNSSLKLSTTITQTGGVVTWTPNLPLMDSVVYYWRCGLDSVTYNRPTGWHYSSFIYLDGEYPGWNQSHYYQYLKDDFNNLYLDNDRVLKFVDDIKNVTARSGTTADFGYNGSVPWEQLAHYLNGALKHRWVCGGEGFPNGIVVAVFDSISGQPWISKYSDTRNDNGVTNQRFNQVHGNIHCKTRDFEGFDFPIIVANNQSATGIVQTRLNNFINSIPNGNYILAYSVNSGFYNSWSGTLRNTFTNLGTQELQTLFSTSNSPWAFFVKKGDPSTAVELKGNGIKAIVDLSATFNASWNQGTMTTPLIGPAYEWGSVHWKYHALESNSMDQQQLDIIGVTATGIETVVYSGLKSLDTAITFINPNTYPYIKLRLHTRDDANRTPTQLNYWRVLYKKVPEAALHPDFHFTFVGDTINMGEELQLSIAVENVTNIHMDSLLVKYTLMTTGNPSVNNYVRYDSLRANDIVNLDWLFNTDCNCLGEINTLIIEVNPDNDQPEQYHFNNIGILTFKMDKDKINPLLDVTFDGVHIMDGDIVSAEPEILIRLKDENKYLLLNDTSLINVFLKSPSGQQVKMHYDGISMQFMPAGSSANNTAEVRLKKEFEEDGVYTLLVQAKDRSRNISGTYGVPQDGVDFRISFEVIRESRITNVLNYPNPFTSSTRFVFTLTGMQPPDFFKIQIMTVSGKVVRELTQTDLGNIRVGNNITEYAWDGTDQYGDPLGNGLYLYRVVASIDGKQIEKMNSGADKYFKSGFGKMYLAR